MNHIEQVLARYRKQGVLLDTNLLLLYTVGMWDSKQIPLFKRTKTFTEDDYILLAFILKQFERVITTPNILTEVSNLAGQLSESFHDRYYHILSKRIETLDEQYLPSRQAVLYQKFSKFGLTDTTIRLIADQTYLVLTEDWKLGQYLQSQAVDVLNFNHLRYYKDM